MTPAGPRLRRSGRSLAVALGLLGALLAATTPPTRASSTDGTPVLATMVVTHGGVATTLAVEIADTPEEMARGLMGRTDLGAADGMAFVWLDPTSVGFWMKNTLIPLSIAFWDEDGTIVAMLDMEPCTSDPCPVYYPGVSYQGAVEVEQGALEARGIALGDGVSLVSRFDPPEGEVGTSVEITGFGLIGTGVTFSGVAAAFVVDSPTRISAVVPASAGTGPIAVGLESGAATISAEAFVVRHARNLGLHFSAARGSVSVPDGWSGCASEVPVQLQLRGDGGYRTIASASTSPDGDYRFGHVRELGAYRVVAKKVTLPTGDVCLKAVSRTARA